MGGSRQVRVWPQFALEAYAPRLLQLRVLRLRLLKDGDVGVGIFPNREEILIRCLGLNAVALHGVSAGQLEAGQRSPLASKPCTPSRRFQTLNQRPLGAGITRAELF
jgi:hypothetical protein